MHTTIVKLKSGEEVSGPIWEFRPKEGYMTLATVEDENGDLRKLRFAEMESAVTPHERLSVKVPDGEQDELVRARESGWDGT